jgi:hypothetical protein
MDRNKSGFPGKNQENNNQEEFFSYAESILDPYLKEKIEKALDTDSIFGTISGWVKTVPKTYFEVTFDTDKKDLELSVYKLLKEKFNSMDVDHNTEFETLNADVSIASESEKNKPTEKRESRGGFRALVYKK